MDTFDLVSSLQALPETNPIEIDGIQFGGAGATCQVAACTGTITAVNTVCVVTC